MKTLSKYICACCGGDQIGWDAWADENGKIISVFDHNECLECGATNIAKNWVEQEGTK